MPRSSVAAGCPCGALRLRPENSYWSRGGGGYSGYSGYLRYSSHGASVSAHPDGSLVFRPESPEDVDAFVRHLVDEAVAGWVLGC